MKDTSRPHPSQSSRSAPYRKSRFSLAVSPVSATRSSRPSDASRIQDKDRSPRSPDRSRSSHRGNTKSSRAASSPDGRRGSSSSSGENRAVSHARSHTNPDGSVRGWPAHTSALSIRADVPGPSLRLPLTSVPPTTPRQTKAESPPDSATAFLRSIGLPDKLASTSAPPLQTSLSAQTAANAAAAGTNGNDNQVSLVYKGYPFTYDLSALPDDPKGTIALLTIIKSDPGPYLLVGAHYRRTGRARAACAVIRSLLDSLDGPFKVEKGKRDAALPAPASDASTATLVSPRSPSPSLKPTMSGFNGGAMRPAMLLLAACELDISREHPGDPESASHASEARDLFRAVYGTVNDAIVAGAARPQTKNALGLEFPRNRNCSSCSSSDPTSKAPRSALPPDGPSLTRVKNLEKQLSTSRDAQEKLRGKLVSSNDLLARAEDKVYALESRARDMLIQLDVMRDKNWELRQRLVEAEERERELVRYEPSAETRVWGRLKDFLFDNLGGGGG